jgi:hypothetical protein
MAGEAKAANRVAVPVASDLANPSCFGEGQGIWSASAKDSRSSLTSLSNEGPFLRG